MIDLMMRLHQHRNCKQRSTQHTKNASDPNLTSKPTETTMKQSDNKLTSTNHQLKRRLNTANSSSNNNNTEINKQTNKLTSKLIPSESERGRCDSEARTETCDAAWDLLPTPALLVAPTLSPTPCPCSTTRPTRRWQARTKYLLPTVRRVSSETAYFRPFCHHHDR